VKASAAMISLSALVAGVIAFYPQIPPVTTRTPDKAASPHNGGSLPVGALASAAFGAEPAAPTAASPPLTRSVRAKPAASDVAEANRKLAEAMTKPKSLDGLSQIALAAGGPSPNSTLGRPAGTPTGVLAFADTRTLGETAAATQELIARARAQLRDGAASAARLLLTRAARSGSAEALALLGQSYDAAALSELGVKGVRPDAAEARKYYQQAAAAGSTDAKRRLAKLGD
jgi:TPR repeat protein